MNKAIAYCLKPALLLALPALLLQACAPKADAPLLEGKINTAEPVALSVVYDYEGDNYVEELTTDSAGRFAYNPDLAGTEADLILFVGSDLYGAYVKKGSHARIDIDGGKATFAGDNTDRCAFVNALYQAYSPWDGTGNCNKAQSGCRKPSTPWPTTRHAPATNDWPTPRTSITPCRPSRWTA